MNQKDNIGHLLNKAAGNRTIPAFAKEAGITIENLERTLNENKVPSQNTLLRISRHAQNGITYQQLCESCGYKPEEAFAYRPEILMGKLNNDEAFSDLFSKAASRISVRNAETPEAYLAYALDTVRDLAMDYKAEHINRYQAVYEKEEKQESGRIYRIADFILPESDSITTIKIVITWIPESGKCHECRILTAPRYLKRYFPKAVKKENTNKIYYETDRILPRTVAETDSENDWHMKNPEGSGFDVPFLQEGYGFYVDDEHLFEADSYCEAHEDYLSVRSISSDYLDFSVNNNAGEEVWRNVAEIMSVIYGMPFIYRRQQELHELNEVHDRSMIMIPKDQCNDDFNIASILSACNETAYYLNIPYYGTVWFIKNKVMESLPEYRTMIYNEKELKECRKEYEADPDNLDKQFHYLEMLQEKSRTIDSSQQFKKILIEAEHITEDSRDDFEIMSALEELRRKYSDLNTNALFHKELKEQQDKIKDNPSSEEIEIYLTAVDNALPYLTYYECKELKEDLQHLLQYMMDPYEIVILTKKLEEQMMRRDPYMKHAVTTNLYNRVQQEYEESPSLQNAREFALFLRLNRNNNGQLYKAEEIHHHNPYNSFIADTYAYFLNKNVLNEEKTISEDLLVHYAEELSKMKERFPKEENIEMAWNNTQTVLRRRQAANKTVS